MKKAIVFGASGFIGSYLLENLLASKHYAEVIVVVREKLINQHPKLKLIIADYETLTNHKSELVADDVFVTLGTTKKKTPDPEKYYQVDHDYPVLAAKLTKENGATSIFMVTAAGADVDSGIFYSKTKGEVERDVLKINFAHTHIFRPSMILGERQERRPLEKFFMSLSTGLNFLMIGKLSKYKGISAEDVAQAMFNAAQHAEKNIEIYHWEEMQALLAQS